MRARAALTKAALNYNFIRQVTVVISRIRFQSLIRSFMFTFLLMKVSLRSYIIFYHSPVSALQLAASSVFTLGGVWCCFSFTQRVS